MTSHGQRERQVTRLNRRVLCQMSAQLFTCFPQCLRRARRQDKGQPSSRVGVGRSLRGLLQNHVRIGSTDSEGADPCPAWMCVRTWPVLQLGGDIERRRGEIDPGVRAVIVQARGNLPVLQAESRFHEASDAGGSIEVPHVGLHRTDRAGCGFPTRMNCCQCGDLDRVSQSGASTMGLDVADARRLNAASRQGLLDHARLTGLARGGVPDLIGPIVVEGTALDHGNDAVAIGEGCIQWFQQNRAGPIAAHHTVSVGIKGAAMPIGREDHPFLVQVAPLLGEAESCPAGQDHVTVTLDQ